MAGKIDFPTAWRPIAAFLVLSTGILAQGCQTNVPNRKAVPYGPQVIVFEDKVTERIIAVTAEDYTAQTGGLGVRLSVQNLTRRPLDALYKIDWFDGEKNPVARTLSEWQEIELEPETTVNRVIRAPNTRAIQYRISIAAR